MAGPLALPAEHSCCFPLSLGRLSPGADSQDLLASHQRWRPHSSGPWLPSGSVCGSQERCVRGTQFRLPLSHERPGCASRPRPGRHSSASKLSTCTSAPTRHLFRAPWRGPRPPRLTGGHHCRVPGTWPFRQSVQQNTILPTPPGHALCQHLLEQHAFPTQPGPAAATGSPGQGPAAGAV